MADTDFWSCGLCGELVPLGTSHDCRLGAAFFQPSGIDRIITALERIAAALEDR